jgi:hypothetical protein
MYRIGINIYEKIIVHKVGYLQELNPDTRSTKRKILTWTCLFIEAGVYIVHIYRLNL